MWNELEVYRPHTIDAAVLRKRVKEDKIFQLLANLGSDYEDLRSHILISLELPSFSSICSMIQREEVRRKVMKVEHKSPLSDTRAYATNHQPKRETSYKGKRPNLKCHRCHHLGHLIERCWVLHPELKPKFAKDKGPSKHRAHVTENLARRYGSGLPVLPNSPSTTANTSSNPISPVSTNRNTDQSANSPSDTNAVHSDYSQVGSSNCSQDESSPVKSLSPMCQDVPQPHRYPTRNHEPPRFCYLLSMPSNLQMERRGDSDDRILNYLTLLTGLAVVIIIIVGFITIYPFFDHQSSQSPFQAAEQWHAWLAEIEDLLVNKQELDSKSETIPSNSDSSLEVTNVGLKSLQHKEILKIFLWES
ncbi:hypothetical protein L6164_017593 [Bauhinia variegata]|uniref:Uncharacterized protein n=1 Tax=Bauhinia variegata TaxID=167791 RepID=A0ACB9N8L1_BAUVA|nr:hypothetical protein L6164_017593 [Bauhinia variegata]